MAHLTFPRLKENEPFILLPLSARVRLQAAARIAAVDEAGNSKPRTVAIEETIKDLRKQYPHAFIDLTPNGFPVSGSSIKRRSKPRFKGKK